MYLCELEQLSRFELEYSEWKSDALTNCVITAKNLRDHEPVLSQCELARQIVVDHIKHFIAVLISIELSAGFEPAKGFLQYLKFL